MRLFKCKHPANALVVLRPHDTTKHNADFDRIDYHLLCSECQQPVDVTYFQPIVKVR